MNGWQTVRSGLSVKKKKKKKKRNEKKEVLLLFLLSLKRGAGSASVATSEINRTCLFLCVLLELLVCTVGGVSVVSSFVLPDFASEFGCLDFVFLFFNCIVYVGGCVWWCVCGRGGGVNIYLCFWGGGAAGGWVG